ncbi:hypothetical protein QTG54_008265 [Skeletonema marinoi]|uniref:Uncharacterized protein n=1 Tax=Skeletonema marinoi TaxID=267567 RepID=A0AAD9DCT4_9STRA|nr:hypothetical protein QTG54_008265 [Skeletonema marinoi]
METQSHVVGSLISSLILLTIYMSTALAEGSVAALPWYFFALFLLTPFICLLINEKILKNSDRLIDRRNEMMRRLQLKQTSASGWNQTLTEQPSPCTGMWSPKESQHVNIQQTNMQPDDSPIV